MTTRANLGRWPQGLVVPYHHGSTSLVQFDSALLQLGGLVEVLPAKVEGSIAVVTNKFGLVVQPRSITVDNFSNGEEGEHLKKNILSVLGFEEGREGLQTIRDALSSRESESGGRGQVSSNCQHGNTSVFDFVFSEQVKLFLAAICDESQGIKKSELEVINRESQRQC